MTFAASCCAGRRMQRAVQLTSLIVALVLLATRLGLDAVVDAWAPPNETAAASGRPLSPMTGPAASAPRLFLVVRTYAGARGVFERGLRPSLESFAFLGPATRLVILLDDDSAADHSWGDELLFSFSEYAEYVTVRYVPPPSRAVLDMKPLEAWDQLMGGRYASDGASRAA